MSWRTALVLALVAACGDRRDDCTKVKDRVRPVLVAMFRDAGKPLPDAKREELLAEFCPAANAGDRENKLFVCVRDAADQSGVAGCLQDAFAEFRSAVAGVARRDAGVPDVALVADAGSVADAAVATTGPTRTIEPIAISSLPELPVPAVAGKGTPIELYAIDADARMLLTALAPHPLLQPSGEERITGRLHATKAGAFAAVAARLGIAPKPARFAGRGVAVDLQFAGAPAIDLLRILADVGRINIVVPGELPKVDVVAKRAPWDGVMSTLASVIERDVIVHGNTRYLVPAGTKLPAAPKLPSGPRIDIDVKDATLAQAVTALQHVTSFPLGACGANRISLRLRGVTAAEVARALEVLGGTPLTAGTTCPTVAPDVTKIDDIKLTVIAEARGKRIAVYERGGVTSVVTPQTPGVNEIGRGYVSFTAGDATLHKAVLPLQQDTADEAWLATLHRVSALVKDGTRWSAYAETDTGTRLFDGSRGYHYDMPIGLQPMIGSAGIEFELGPGNTRRVPFGREVTN